MAEESKQEQCKVGGRYEAALAQARHEDKMMWQRFGAFLVPHTILMAVVLKVGDGHPWHYSYGTFIASIAGFALCVLWLAVYQRSSAFHQFRIAQARKIEPDGWNILAGDGRKFSDGEPIFDWFKPCNDEEFEMPWLAQVLRTRTASYSMILLFLLVYLFVIVSSGPWWIGNG
jgi:hypothetical protein